MRLNTAAALRLRYEGLHQWIGFTWRAAMQSYRKMSLQRHASMYRVSQLDIFIPQLIN